MTLSNVKFFNGNFSLYRYWHYKLYTKIYDFTFVFLYFFIFSDRTLYTLRAELLTYQSVR